MSTFERRTDGWEVTSATNQSTGYCPWGDPGVHAALTCLAETTPAVASR